MYYFFKNSKKLLNMVYNHGIYFVVNKILDRHYPQIQSNILIIKKHGLIYLINKLLNKDYPKTKFYVESITQIDSNKFKLEGWAFCPGLFLSDESSSGLTFHCSNSKNVAIEYQLRSDVQKAFANIKIPEFVGFRIEFETKKELVKFKIRSPSEIITIKINLTRKSIAEKKSVDLYEFTKKINFPSRKRLLTLAKFTGLNLLKQDSDSFVREYEKLLKKSSAFSFDIFDTLIERCVPCPEDVFRLLAAEISGLWDEKLDFVKLRISSELIARKKSRYQEVTLEEIYVELGKLSGLNCEEILQTELQLERQLIKPKRLGFECYEMAVKTKHPIVLISDTYFPEVFISELLADCGYSNWNVLLVSSTHRKTKHHGTLFTELINKLAIEPKKILHIGDNYHSDILMANQCMLNSILMPKSVDIWNRVAPKKWQTLEIENIHERKIIGIIANEFSRNYVNEKLLAKNSWFGNPQLLGFANLGPVLLGFTIWLCQKVKKNENINKLAFLSRDAYFLKLAYDVAAKFDHNLPESVYLAASRQLCMGSTIFCFDDIIKVARVDHYPMSLVDFLINRFGYSYLEVTLIPKHHYDQSGILNFNELIIPNSEKLEKFLFGIKETILLKMEKKRQSYFRYLDSLNINDEVALIDIGYSGTAQYEISKLTSSSISAYYFISNQNAIKLAESNLQHDSWIAKLTNNSHPFFNHVQLWELFLSATHGSIIGINEDFEYIYDRSSIPDDNTKLALSLIRKGAMNFVDSIFEIYGKEVMDWEIDVEFVTTGINDYFSNPCPKDIALFTNLKFEDKFGGDYRNFLITNKGLEDKSVWKEGSKALNDSMPLSIYDSIKFESNLLEDSLSTPSYRFDDFKNKFTEYGIPLKTIHNISHITIIFPYFGQDINTVQRFLDAVSKFEGPSINVIIANFNHISFPFSQIIECENLVVKNFSSFSQLLEFLLHNASINWWLICSGYELFNSLTSLEIEATIRSNSEASIITFDYDYYNSEFKTSNPHFTPEFSPHLLLSTPYIGSSYAVSRKHLLESEFDISLFDETYPWEIISWSLFWQLSFNTNPNKIIRIPIVLFSITKEKPNDHKWNILRNSALKLTKTFYSKLDINCEVIIPEWAESERLTVCTPVFSDVGPSVAIIIPTKNGFEIVKTCIESILSKTTYKNYKIYLIDNDSDDVESLDYFRKLGFCGVNVLKISSPPDGFSYSYVNNCAAKVVSEDLLLFLNNDTEVIAGNWLTQMVGWSKLPLVGSVGARLFFPQKLIQHAGITHKLQWGSLPAPSFKLLPMNESGYHNYINLPRDSAAQTAACLLTARDVFFKFGMFDDLNFKVAYNDCDYGFKLARSGLYNIYCPDAQLFHYEGLTRGSGSGNDKVSEEAAFVRKYYDWNDPYYNPNLTKKNTNFSFMPTVRSSVFLNKKKIAVGTHNLNLEGAPIVIYELVKGLLESGEYEILIISLVDGFLKSKFEEIGCRVHVIDRPDDLFSSSINNYQPILNNLGSLIYGFDVVLANTVLCWWLIETASLINIPAIWIIHESEPKFKHLLDRGVDIDRAVSALSYAYRVIFGSRSTLTVYSEYETVNNFFVIYNGFDYSSYTKKKLEIEFKRDEVRDFYGCDDNRVLLILPATVCERKGQLDLIGAIKLIEPSLLNKAHFLIIGDNSSNYSDMLHKSIRDLDPASQRCISVIPVTDEIFKYYIAADIMLLTSRLESFPKVIQEAMFFELPIITTPVNGISEQVRDEVSAIFYTPGNTKELAEQITRLLTDRNLRESLSLNAKISLSLLPTIEEMVSEYNNIINEACISNPEMIS